MESGTTEWAAMMNRLERLEKQNRRFKQIGALVLILAGSVLLMGQAPGTRTVEANEFVLRDESGMIRGRMFAGQQQQDVAIALYDAKGQNRANLGIAADQPYLSTLIRNYGDVFSG